MGRWQGPPWVTRQLIGLAVVTSIGSIGLAAGGTAGALVAADVTGHQAASGLPLAALVAGSAASVLIVTRASRRHGRLIALAMGYGLGAVGAIVVLVAVGTSSLAALLAGSALLGGPNAAVFLTRYAATDLAPPERQGRALGLLLAATAGGAVAGAVLLGTAAGLAGAVGVPGSAGLYLLAFPAFGFAAMALARRGWSAHVARGDAAVAVRVASARDILSLARVPGPVRDANVALATANLVMTSVMVVIPLHLTDHHHRLHAIGVLVGVHVAGMFAPAPIMGWLADAFGGHRVSLGGLLVLLLAAGLLGVTDAASAAGTGGALLALGIGWNAAVVGASARLTAATAVGDRLSAEAGGELAKEAGAALGVPAAGAVTAAIGFPGLCALLVLTCLLGLLVSARASGPPSEPVAAACGCAHDGPGSLRQVASTTRMPSTTEHDVQFRSAQRLTREVR